MCMPMVNAIVLLLVVLSSILSCSTTPPKPTHEEGKKSESAAQVEAKPSEMELIRKADEAFQAAKAANDNGNYEESLRQYNKMLELMLAANVDPGVFYNLRDDAAKMLASKPTEPEKGVVATDPEVPLDQYAKNVMDDIAARCSPYKIDLKCLPITQNPQTREEAAQFEAIMGMCYKLNFLRDHPGASEPIKNAVRTGGLVVGMPEDAVKASIGCPAKEIENSSGATAWIYANDPTWLFPKYDPFHTSKLYVYMKNGNVTEWTLMK